MPDDHLKEHLLREFVTGPTSRRAFIGRLAAAGASAVLANGVFAVPALAANPKKGGKLTIGTESASITDKLDPTRYSSTANISMGWAVYDPLVNRDANLRPVPWLATSWEPNKDGSSWVFNIRKNVTFHDGSNLTSDDVIYALGRNYKEGSQSPAKPYMSQIKSIDKLTDHQIRINLAGPNADFPLILSDIRTHITKAGVEEFSGKPVGTGPFKVVEFKPGVRYIFSRNSNYWGSDGPYIEQLEYIGIADNTARINALLAGDINALLQLDQKATKLIDRSGRAYVISAKSAAIMNLAMMMDRAPSENADLRLAVKYALDRKAVRDNVLKGYGSIGNDHPIAPVDPYYNSEIPQRVYDPDKARFHIRKARLENTPINIYASDSAGTGSLAAVQLLQQSAAAAGVKFNVINSPADSYWASVWRKMPICTSGWDPRSTPDILFSLLFKSTADYNETKWKNPKFDQMLLDARSALEFTKRKEIYGEMQKMLNDDGGHINLAFRDYVDAARTEVKGITPHPGGPLGNFQGHRTAWIDS